MSIEEKVGALVVRLAPKHPLVARRVLEVAYSYVAMKRYFVKPTNITRATEVFNAHIAKYLVAGLKHLKRSVMVNIFMPCELLHAFDLNLMFPEVLSVYLACTFCATHFLDVAEKCGIPDSLCSYHKAMLGIAESGVLPAPAFIVNTTMACDANNLTFRHCEEFFGSSHFVIDVPHDISESSISYVKDQLEALAVMLENCFGYPLKCDRLVRICVRAKETLTLLREYANVRSEVTLPTTLTSELCLLIATHCLLGTKSAKTYVEEMLALAKKAPVASSSAKPRIFWVHTMPNWQVSVQRVFDAATKAELVGNDMSYDILDTLDALNPNDPFDFMARKLVYCSLNGAAERRIAASLRYAKELQAQGVILFGQGGCKQTLALAQLMQKAAIEKGLAFLELDGDGCDERLAFDGQVTTRLEAFVEQLTR